MDQFANRQCNTDNIADDVADNFTNNIADNRANGLLGIVVIIRIGFMHYYTELFHLLRNLGDYAACLCAIKFE